MKYLLSICLLALPTVGWAGEPTPIERQAAEHGICGMSRSLACVTQEALTTAERQRGEELSFALDGSLKIDKASFDALLREYPDAKLRVTLVPDPCLATMEAAMRAMDRFRPGILYLEAQIQAFTAAIESRLIDTEQRRFLTALAPIEAQWDAAKHKCWKGAP